MIFEIWWGVIFEGVEVCWYFEVQEVFDDLLVLVQLVVLNYCGSCWILFFIELEGDVVSFVGEIGKIFVDSVE